MRGAGQAERLEQIRPPPVHDLGDAALLDAQHPEVNAKEVR
jgi:hypothetical protein